MVKILTDSTCDISFDELEKIGVTVIPLSVFFGEKEYKDQVELSASEFYKKLEEVETLPTTSQINPGTFEKVFEELIADEDEVLGLFLSGGLSGTCQSARVAAQSVDPDKIFVVDSKNATVGIAVLLSEAVKLRDEGYSAKEMKIILDDMKTRVRLIAMVSTLKYLCMGGRISKTAATFGTLLGIYPIIQVVDGKVTVAAKVKGKKAAMKYLADFIEEHPADGARTFGFAHSNNLEDLEIFKAQISDKIPASGLVTCNIGSTIGTHVGPGAIAAAYIE